VVAIDILEVSGLAELSDAEVDGGRAGEEGQGGRMPVENGGECFWKPGPLALN
jgi:hypothetical protein